MPALACRVKPDPLAVKRTSIGIRGGFAGCLDREFGCLRATVPPAKPYRGVLSCSYAISGTSPAGTMKSTAHPLRAPSAANQSCSTANSTAPSLRCKMRVPTACCPCPWGSKRATTYAAATTASSSTARAELSRCPCGVSAYTRVSVPGHIRSLNGIASYGSGSGIPRRRMPVGFPTSGRARTRTGRSMATTFTSSATTGWSSTT